MSFCLFITDVIGSYQFVFNGLVCADLSPEFRSCSGNAVKLPVNGMPSKGTVKGMRIPTEREDIIVIVVQKQGATFTIVQSRE